MLTLKTLSIYHRVEKIETPARGLIIVGNGGH
jgi:hypothetical protein